MAGQLRHFTAGDLGGAQAAQMPEDDARDKNPPSFQDSSYECLGTITQQTGFLSSAAIQTPKALSPPGSATGIWGP
jgi:Leucine-rich repeat (LRR) protein